MISKNKLWAKVFNKCLYFTEDTTCAVSGIAIREEFTSARFRESGSVHHTYYERPNNSHMFNQL